MKWYLRVISNYATFQGRASRSEYWFFVLFNIFVAIGAIIIDNVLGITFKDIPYGPVYIIYSLAVFIPGLAVSVRRLHDTGKSGWYLLMSLIPCLGGLILLYFMVVPSDSSDNAYGPVPSSAP